MKSRLQSTARSFFNRFVPSVMRHRAERVLPAPPSSVWALWEDPSGWDQNMLAVRDVTVGPRGPGTVFEVRMRILGGLTTTQREEIVQYDPPRAFGVRGGQWGVSYRHGLTLEPIGDGQTRCVCDSEVTMRGPLRLAAPLIRRMEKQGLADRLRLLDEHVATRPS